MKKYFVTLFSNLFLLFRALLGALFGLPLEHYPRQLKQKGKCGPKKGTERMSTAALITEINSALQQLQFKNEEDAKYHLDQIKDSFAEVKQATEYQDQKTARLLTILAFLTAAAGTVFAKILDVYPLRVSSHNISEFIIAMTYSLFGIYMILISCGALISFYAMQTRFVIPEEPEVVNSSVKSFLFFKQIHVTQPSDWGKKLSLPALDMLKHYYKQYAIETYLIAAKTGDKVRYLEPAQRLLQWSIKVLMLWILSVTALLSFVPRSETGAAQLNSPAANRADRVGKDALIGSPTTANQNDNTAKTIASGGTTKPILRGSNEKGTSTCGSAENSTTAPAK